jgi:hypothetical protein
MQRTNLQHLASCLEIPEAVYTNDWDIKAATEESDTEPELHKTQGKRSAGEVSIVAYFHCTQCETSKAMHSWGRTCQTEERKSNWIPQARILCV